MFLGRTRRDDNTDSAVSGITSRCWNNARRFGLFLLRFFILRPQHLVVLLSCSGRMLVSAITVTISCHFSVLAKLTKIAFSGNRSTAGLNWTWNTSNVIFFGCSPSATGIEWPLATQYISLSFSLKHTDVHISPIWGMLCCLYLLASHSFACIQEQQEQDDVSLRSWTKKMRVESEKVEQKKEKKTFQL